MARAAVAASVATFAALLSHVVGGGAMPAPAGIAVPWVLSLAVCTTIAGRRLSLSRLSVAVPLSQLLFHALFVVGSPASSAGVPVPAGAHSHLPLTITAVGGESLAADPAMWIGHALAALATVALLHRGERVTVAAAGIAASLTSWVRRQLRMPVAQACVPASAPRVLGTRIAVPPRSRLGADAVDPRGPPLFATA